MEDVIKEYTTKYEFMNWIKLFSQMMTSYQINEMVIGDTKVWVSTYSNLVLPNQQNLIHDSFTRFWIKDNQIEALLHQGRLLDTLVQYGAIIMQQDDQEKVTRYLQSLTNMGLIPKLTSGHL